MKMIHRTLTTALTVMFLIMVGQVAESAQWPKKTQWGLRCLENSHCKNTKKYNGKPAVCRKKVKSNKFVSKNKYCMKALWDGAPCTNSDQCSSGMCDSGKCSKYAKEVYVNPIAPDATPPAWQKDMNDLKQALNELKDEIKNLKEDAKCNWMGHDRILIKPRDFFQIAGTKLKTDYYDKGGALELSHGYDVLAQYIIPKNCKATEVTISMNAQCNGFKVFTSKLLHKENTKTFESNINPNTIFLGGGEIKDKATGYDHDSKQFTLVTTTVKPLLTGVIGKLLSVVILDSRTVESDYAGRGCDVSGGYIKLEPVN